MKKITRLQPGSVVLTRSGWSQVNTLDRGANLLLGIDRFGRLTPENVDISANAETFDRCCFVGAPSAFAALTLTTRVLTSSGAESVATIVHRGSPTEWVFEGVAHAGFEGDGGTGQLLWAAAETLAVARTASSILIACRRCYSRDTPRWATLRRSRTTDYCGIKRTDFIDAAEDNWPRFVQEFCKLVASDEDGRIVWDRRHHIWPLWYLSATNALKHSARLFFNSLQHTVTVECVPVEHGVPLGRGACAFATPYGVGSVDASWTGSGWHLIVGGILVS